MSHPKCLALKLDVPISEVYGLGFSSFVWLDFLA